MVYYEEEGIGFWRSGRSLELVKIGIKKSSQNKARRTLSQVMYCVEEGFEGNILWL